MAARTCPGCQRRYAGLIDPDCVICDGNGVVQLGAPALHREDPVVIARAIEVYLEASARTISESLPIGEPRVEALAGAVLELRHAGLVADPLTTASTRLTTVAAPPERPRCRRPEPAARDVVRDLFGYSLILGVVGGRWRATPLDDDAAARILRTAEDLPSMETLAHAG